MRAPGRARPRVPRPLEAVRRDGGLAARVEHGAAADQRWLAAGHLGPGARSWGHGLAGAGGDVGAALTE